MRLDRLYHILLGIIAISLTIVSAAGLVTAVTGQAAAGEEVLLPVRTPAGPPLPEPDPFSAPLPAKGKFLVASNRILDPHFHESVVLLIGYSSDGAAGIIINRPTEALLAEVLSSVKGLKGRRDVVYYGGPVENQRLTMLLRAGAMPAESGKVFEDVYASTSRNVLESMLSARKTSKQFRVYSGYAGWRPGQLDRELARGDWLVVKADANTIFEKKTSEIWPELMRRGPEIQVMVPDFNRFAVR